MKTIYILTAALAALLTSCNTTPRLTHHSWQASGDYLFYQKVREPVPYPQTQDKVKLKAELSYNDKIIDFKPQSEKVFFLSTAGGNGGRIFQWKLSKEIPWITAAAGNLLYHDYDLKTDTVYYVDRDILRMSQTGQLDRIFKKQINGKAVELGRAFQMDPLRLSTDGKRLVYACRNYASSPWQIWILDLKTGKSSYLCKGRRPSWHGKHIYFDRIGESGRREIWLTDLEGRIRKKVIDDPEFDCIQAVSNPNGTAIAYVIEQRGIAHSRDIFIYYAKDQRKQIVTRNPSRDDLPRFGRSNNLLYFRSTYDRSWGIYEYKIQDLD